MPKRYDLIAVGGGSTGLVAALTAARVGARVALIERDRTGGDCLWTGCVPSKALLASAARAQAIRTAADFGIDAVEPVVDFPRVMARVRDVIERIGREDTPEHLRSQGVDVFEAEARFIGPGRLTAGSEQLLYRTAVIGTGSRPTLPPIPGLSDAHPLTNESVFELERLPTELVVLGGGPIGCELGQAFTRLGSRVTVIEALPRLLPREEPFAGELLREILEEEGATVRTGGSVQSVTPSRGSAGQVGAGTLALADGTEISFDRILVATGRAAVTDGLGLETVGVATEAGGAIIVDDRLRTSGDRIFAGGDVIDDLQFTHVAAYHGLVAMANALFRARQKVERHWTPWATFTDPEIAHVGLTEERARAERGDEIEIYEHGHSQLDRAVIAGARGSVKLVTDRRSRLLGATIVGPAASESIIEPAKVIREGGKITDVSQMIHVFPSFSEGPARAADDYWRRRFLTPSMRRWLRPLLALLRRIDRPRG